MFNLSNDTLQRCLRIHHFESPRTDEAPTDGLAFFAIRGALPVNTSFWDFAPQHALVPANVTHRSLCCTIGLWNMRSGGIAVFAGSTVPNVNAMAGSNQGGEAANQMLESRVRFIKGVHATKHNPVGYRAFVQDMKFALQRVRNDRGKVEYDFDSDDVIQVDSVGDHLHAASIETTKDVGPAFFSSFGCQVVIGLFQRSPDGRPTLGGTGGWDKFVRHVYGLGQQKFVYYLLHSDDVQAAAVSAPNTVAVRLRFGSKSDLVASVQEKLNALSAGAAITIDRDYGHDTLMAAQAFQRSKGLLADCSVGANTAQALGFADRDWPKC